MSISTPSTLTRIALTIATIATIAGSLTAAAQVQPPMPQPPAPQPAVPLPAAHEHEVPLARVPGGIRFLGSAGFLDYDRGVAPSNRPLTPLVLFASDRMEPPEALRPGEIQGRTVEYNWPFLDALDIGGDTHCAFPLINGEVRELVFVHKETFGEQQYNWYGQIAGIPASDFILSRYREAIVLEVRDYDRKERFSVRFAPPIGDLPPRNTLILPGAEPASGWCETPSPSPVNPPGGDDGGVDIGNGGDGNFGITSAADPTNVVDVLFLASVEYRGLLNNSTDQLRGVAQFLVADFNMRSANSNTGVVMRVAGVDLIPGYQEAASGSTDLAAMRSSSGNFVSLPSVRSMVRADHVVLLRRYKWPSGTGSGNTLGVAYRPISLQNATADLGFSVVCSENDWAATFSHEIGHNFGACHDAAQGACSSAVTSSPHGKRWSCNRLACTDHWHTTMAYANNSGTVCSASTRVPYFSNPALTFVTPAGCSNFVLGDSISNVAGLIQTSRPRVSQWQIGSSRRWVDASYGQGGTGTYFTPYGRVSTAVALVSGGTAQGQVFVSGGVYNETSLAGGRVVYSNPCVVTIVGGPNSSFGPALLR